MGTWHIVLLLVTLLVVFPQVLATQTRPTIQAVPKHDAAAEATFRGTITTISNRVCPITGGMGSHFMQKQADGQTIEVHVAASRFIKAYEIALNKGNQVEVLGSRAEFDCADAIPKGLATRWQRDLRIPSQERQARMAGGRRS